MRLSSENRGHYIIARRCSLSSPMYSIHMRLIIWGCVSRTYQVSLWSYFSSYWDSGRLLPLFQLRLWLGKLFWGCESTPLLALHHENCSTLAAYFLILPLTFWSSNSFSLGNNSMVDWLLPLKESPREHNTSMSLVHVRNCSASLCKSPLITAGTWYTKKWFATVF